MHGSKLETRVQKIFNKQVLTWKLKEHENLDCHFMKLVKEFVKPKLRYARR